MLTKIDVLINRGKKVDAFSLPELLVVLVIIGILVLMALPNLMPLIIWKYLFYKAERMSLFLYNPLSQAG